jgi:hypothetical protein
MFFYVMLFMPCCTNEDNMHQCHDIHATANDAFANVPHSVSICSQQIAVPSDFRKFGICHMHWHEQACRGKVVGSYCHKWCDGASSKIGVHDDREG